MYLLSDSQAEHVTRAYRTEYVRKLLNHDVEYIDSMSPGRLGQRFSEQSSGIIGGLGPELGILVRTFGSLLCGMVIGFIYVVLGCSDDHIELAAYAVFYY